MQILVKFSLLALVALSACSTSNQVNNASVFQKRKYTKGWHINRSANTAKNKNDQKPILFFIEYIFPIVCNHDH